MNLDLITWVHQNSEELCLILKKKIVAYPIWIIDRVKQHDFRKIHEYNILIQSSYYDIYSSLWIISD